MAVVANMGASRPSQVSTTSKGNALQTPTYNGSRNTKKIVNFFCKLETYFGAVGIMDEVQKVNTPPSLLRILPLFVGVKGVMMSTEDPPITTWDGFKRELKE